MISIELPRASRGLSALVMAGASALTGCAVVQPPAPININAPQGRSADVVKNESYSQLAIAKLQAKAGLTKAMCEVAGSNPDKSFLGQVCAIDLDYLGRAENADVTPILQSYRAFGNEVASRGGSKAWSPCMTTGDNLICTPANDSFASPMSLNLTSGAFVAPVEAIKPHTLDTTADKAALLASIPAITIASAPAAPAITASAPVAASTPASAASVATKYPEIRFAMSAPASAPEAASAPVAVASQPVAALRPSKPVAKAPAVALTDKNIDNVKNLKSANDNAASQPASASQAKHPTKHKSRIISDFNLGALAVTAVLGAASVASALADRAKKKTFETVSYARDNKTELLVGAAVGMGTKTAITALFKIAGVALVGTHMLPTVITAVGLGAIAGGASGVVRAKIRARKSGYALTRGDINKALISGMKAGALTGGIFGAFASSEFGESILKSVGHGIKTFFSHTPATQAVPTAAPAVPAAPVQATAPVETPAPATPTAAPAHPSHVHHAHRVHVAATTPEDIKPLPPGARGIDDAVLERARAWMQKTMVKPSL